MPEASLPLTKGCTSPGAAIQGELTGSPIPIEPTIDGGLYLAAEIWAEGWPAAHDRDIWSAGADGTCGNAWRNDATAWSFDE